MQYGTLPYFFNNKLICDMDHINNLLSKPVYPVDVLKILSRYIFFMFNIVNIIRMQDTIQVFKLKGRNIEEREAILYAIIACWLKFHKKNLNELNNFIVYDQITVQNLTVKFDDYHKNNWNNIIIAAKNKARSDTKDAYEHIESLADGAASFSSDAASDAASDADVKDAASDAKDAVPDANDIDESDVNDIALKINKYAKEQFKKFNYKDSTIQYLVSAYMYLV
jgi:hypothetical protein